MPLILNGTTGVSGVDGTAGTPAAQGSDTNTGVFYGTDTVSISTGGTARVVVNSSGQTVLGAGTAALPAVTTTGDTNTGVFFPAADTVAFAEGGVESARFDSSGNFLVGLTSTSGGAGLGRLTIKSNSNTSATNFVIEAVSTTDKWGHIIASNLDYYFNLNGSGKGYINNSTGAYTAVSDARLKKNISDCSYGLEQIKQLRPVTFNMVDESDSDKKHVGFIAQEVKAVIDEAVDDLPSDDRYYGLDKSGLVPVLVKSIQELSAKLDAAEARIAALEAK